MKSSLYAVKKPVIPIEQQPALSLKKRFLVWSGVVVLLSMAMSNPPRADARTRVIPISHGTNFNSWRPYSNPNRLISIGMNKGEVLAIAGKPEHEESYYQSAGRRLIRISDWYYFRTGNNPETTLLKFVQDSLVSITSTQTQ